MAVVIVRSSLNVLLPRLSTVEQVREKEVWRESLQNTQLHVFWLCRNATFPPRAYSLRRKPSGKLGIVGSWIGQVGDTGGTTPLFPRINVRDPYKRLGISREASEEEISDARKFLLDQYGAHKDSAKAIESAYDKIILESLRQRKKLKSSPSGGKKLSPPPAWLTALRNRIESPPLKVVLFKAAVFATLGVWSILDRADGSPAFQVLLSLVACIYFIHQRSKSRWKSVVYGFVTFVFGWVLGSFLIPVLPNFIFPGSWNIELMTSLISYLILFIPSTYLK